MLKVLTSWYKKKFNNNKKLPMTEFIPKFFEAIKEISELYNPYDFVFPDKP